MVSERLSHSFPMTDCNRNKKVRITMCERRRTDSRHTAPMTQSPMSLRRLGPLPHTVTRSRFFFSFSWILAGQSLQSASVAGLMFGSPAIAPIRIA